MVTAERTPLPACSPTRDVARSVAAVLLLLAGCNDALEISYRGRTQISDEPMRIVLPMLGGEVPRALVADEDDVVWILPFDGEPCELGRVRAIASYRVSGDYRIGLRVDHEDGTDRVRFVDAECHEHLAPVADAGPTGLVNGYILAEVAGALVAFDPWSDTQATISEQITEVGPLALRGSEVVGLWVLEGDRLRVRDFEGKQLRELAMGVEDIDVAHAADTRLAYSGPAGTFIVDADGTDQRRLYDGGCSLRSEFVGRSARHLTFLSPCESKTLVSIDRIDTEEPRVVEHASDVRSFWTRAVVRGGDSEVWTFYVTEVGDERHSFLARPGGDTVELPIDLPSSHVTMWPWLGGDFVHAHGAWLIVDDQRELGIWDAHEGWTRLAQDVDEVGLALTGWLVLHDVVDGKGVVSAILPDATLEEIAVGVPEGGLLDIAGTGPPAGTVPSRPALTGTLLHDVGDEGATLSAIGASPGELDELVEELAPETLRTFEIRLRGTELVAETEPIGALAYLHGYDSTDDVGELAIRLDDGRSFEIDADVGSFRPSDSQLRPGMLYAITRGPRQGVWFAPQ